MFVITGGSRGIGKALAEVLAKKGQSVLIVGRNETTLREVADTSDNIDYFTADMASDVGLSSLINHLQTAGPIKGLIHNAGIIDPMRPLATISRHEWRQVMTTNLDTPLFLTQALLKQLHKARVLHIGSGAAYFPVASWGAYCVSKAALSMLTRCWQEESTSIYFASVMPGIVDTQMQESIRNAGEMLIEKQDFFKQLKANNQLVSSQTVALFLAWILLETDNETYVSREWDIYESNHHSYWLPDSHPVPFLA